MHLQRRMLFTLVTTIALIGVAMAPMSAAQRGGPSPPGGGGEGFFVALTPPIEIFAGVPTEFTVYASGTEGREIDMDVYWFSEAHEEEQSLHFTSEGEGLPSTVTITFLHEGYTEVNVHARELGTGQTSFSSLYFEVQGEVQNVHPHFGGGVNSDVYLGDATVLEGELVSFDLPLMDDGLGIVDVEVYWFERYTGAWDAQEAFEVQVPRTGGVTTHIISVSHAFQTAGDYNLHVRVLEDQHGPYYQGSHYWAGASGYITVESANAAPELSVLDAAGDEDAAIAIPVEIIDSDAGDSHELFIDYGDGTSETIATTAGAQSIAHVYADPGTYTLHIAVTDAAGESAGALATVEVANVIDSQAEADAALEALKADYKSERKALHDEHKAAQAELDHKDKDGHRALDEQYAADRKALHDEHKAEAQAIKSWQSAS